MPMCPRAIQTIKWRIAPVLCALAGVLLFSTAPALAAEAPKVEEQWVTHVSATAATLQARVDPGEVATTYKFEYATSEAALLAGEGEVVPAPPANEGEAGAGTVGVVVEEHPQNLLAHTSYWYRVVATNGDGKTLGCEVAGTCESFTTRVAGGELELPDNRAWELVSPADKDGAVIQGIQANGAVVQAAEGGGAVTYLSFNPAQSASQQEEPPAGNANESQVLSVRGAGSGWSSRDLATPYDVPTGPSIGLGEEYRWFSPDLSVGLVAPFGRGAPLSPRASERTIYLRDDRPLPPGAGERTAYEEAEREAVDPAREPGYLPLVTDCPSPGEACGKATEFVGASPDLGHVVIRSSTVPLTANTPSGNPTVGGGLYEWTAGAPSEHQLQLVSVLPEGDPNGEQAAVAMLGNSAGEDARGAVSSDGSRIIWSSEGEYEGGTKRTHLFMRDVSSEQTVRLDAVDGGAISAQNAQGAVFQFASSVGSRVFFTDEDPLTAGSTAESAKPELYECEMVEESSGALKCDLRDLTVSTVPGHEAESAEVLGVVSAGSNESSYAYVVANGVLTEAENGHTEKATGGDCSASVPTGEEHCNLYMLHFNVESRHWEAPSFIATLSGADYPDWLGTRGNLPSVIAGVSPDGMYLEFMSERPLTGYDNHDANSGAADEEVYLYSADSGRLTCVSCNPSGQRPAGVFDTGEANEGAPLLVDGRATWQHRWLAGTVPGWTGMSLSVARYQSRYLSDQGRVFFESSDALVPQATNGLMDVYEFEPVGVGGCRSSSGTFSERSDGCVGLISSASSSQESAFIDASESGEDVFFLTSAPLVAGDKDTAFDIYDAHVCSAAAPCSTEAVSPPPCENESSCKPAPTPQPSIFGPGPSETFSGAGNPPPPPPAAVILKTKTVKCAKGKHLSHNKCVKNKHKKKHKAKKSNRRPGR